MRYGQKKGSTVETADLNDCLPYEKVRKIYFIKKIWIESLLLSDTNVKAKIKVVTSITLYNMMAK